MCTSQSDTPSALLQHLVSPSACRSGTILWSPTRGRPIRHARLAATATARMLKQRCYGARLSRYSDTMRNNWNSCDATEFRLFLARMDTQKLHLTELLDFRPDEGVI